MARQLTLGLSLKEDATFSNFYPAKNQQLLSCLTDVTQEQFIYLWGAAGTGRSHLLQACCHQVAESSVYIPLSEWQALSPDIFCDLEQLSLVCIDDVNAIKGQRDWEEALFHLYNRIRAAKTRLVVAANASPTQLGLSLADLSTRLAWGLVFHVEPLSDSDKCAALSMRAKQQGMVLSPDVGDFLLRHCPRDTKSLFDLLERLDELSLVAQRRLTIPFVKQALGL